MVPVFKIILEKRCLLHCKSIKIFTFMFYIFMVLFFTFKSQPEIYSDVFPGDLNQSFKSLALNFQHTHLLNGYK